MLPCGMELVANLVKGLDFCRQAHNMGADIALFPEMWSNARAYENMVGIALANYARPMQKGHSMVFHPVSYLSEDDNEQDTLVIEAGEAEGIYIAEFDLDSIRDYRQREDWGDSYRRPGCYGALLNTEAQPPFVREDAQR